LQGSYMGQPFTAKVFLKYRCTIE